MKIRDRIKEFRRVPASKLLPNPQNWRTHPATQKDALRGVLSEVGYAGAIICRELETGELQIIDGHLRAETTPDQDIPVLVLDVNEAEAKYLLATLDPVGDLAAKDSAMLEALLHDVSSANPAVQEMLDCLATEEIDFEDTSSSNPAPLPVAKLEIPPKAWLISKAEVVKDVNSACEHWGISVIWPD